MKSRHSSSASAPYGASPGAKAGGIRRAARFAMRCLLPLAVSAGLVVWLFHRVDFHHTLSLIRFECDYRWLALMMLITMLSHIIRGIRWGIQLRGAGVGNVSAMQDTVAIFGAYALNLVFPNIGELWRIGFVARRTRSKFSTILGTDIGDRISDLAVIMILIAVTAFVARPALVDFMNRYSVGRDIDSILHNPLLWCGIALIAAVVAVLVRFRQRSRLLSGIGQSVRRVWTGFRILFTMRGRGLYLLLTIGIWTCYFMETYVSFMAFPFTRVFISDPAMAYGLIPGLVVFVFGSCSMAIPSNGGLGPWNLAVIFALTLYGVSEPQAAAFSVAMWGFQAMMLVALGIFSAVYVVMTRRRSDAP